MIDKQITTHGDECFYGVRFPRKKQPRRNVGDEHDQALDIGQHQSFLPVFQRVFIRQ